MESIEKKTKESLYWQTIIQSVWEVVRFCLSIVIARILDPRDFGIMGLASILILYSNSLTELGFTNALIQKREINNKHINSVFTVNLLISFLLMFLVIVFSSNIASFFKTKELEDVLKVLSLIFIFTAFSQISITLLKRDLNYKKYTIINFFKSLLQVVVSLILAIMNYGYWSLIIGTVVSELFLSVILLWNIKFFPKLQFHLISFKTLLGFGLWSFMISQISTFYSYVDKAIVGHVLGVTRLGYYDKAFSISFMPIDSISKKINGVMFSSFSRYKDNKKQLCNEFYNIALISSIICFPIFGGLNIVASDFTEVAFGSKWLPMVPAMRILTVGFVFRVVIGLIDSLNMATGNYKVHIKVKIFIILVTICLYLQFVQFGIEAISLIIVASNFLFFITSIGVSKKYLSELSVLKLINNLIPAIINTLLMVLIVYFSSKIILFELQVLNLLIKIIIGALAYIALFFTFKYRVTKELRSKILFVINGVLTKKSAKKEKK